MISEQPLRALLITTKDGDWGFDSPRRGLIPYRVIRGADFPDVRIGNISTTPLRFLDHNSVNRRTLQSRDILIETAGGNRDRPTGRTLFITEHILHKYDYPVTCASFSRFLRIDPSKADPEYVFWYLQYLYSIGFMWEHQVQHTGVARFQYTKFAETTKIPLPELAEQGAIAGVLGALDEKIELNCRMNATLESIAQALFRQWFVEGKQIKEWDAGTVSQDFNLTMGQSPPGKSYNQDGIGTPFFQGRSDFGFRFPNNRVYCTAPTRYANPGDTLVCVRAPVGDLNMATTKCAVGRGVAAIRHKSGSRSYTYYTMKSLEDDFAKFEAEGTVFGSINKADFQNLEIAIPPIKEVEEFEEICFPIDQMIENNENDSNTLANLRDMLLPKLISGQVRVKSVN